MKQFAVVSAFLILVCLLLVLYEHHTTYSMDDPSLGRAPISDTGALPSGNAILHGL